MEDALSSIFRMLKLKSCVYFQRDFCAPWGMSMEQGRFAQFHLVVSGTCIVRVDDKTHCARNGDVLLFPRGYPHQLQDQANTSCMAGPDVMASLNTSTPAFAIGGDAVRLVCGHYEYRDTPPILLIDQLPEFIHVAAFDVAASRAADSVVPLLLREMDTKKPGASSIVEHLAEILLIQTLREYVMSAPYTTGLLIGLADPQLGQALKLVHTHPEFELSVERLAREAGMSRSGFSEKFKTVIGVTPMEYLTKLRILTASDLLREQHTSIPQIAERVGYTSEISFARAFKRETGATPSEYRRRESLN